MWQAEADTQLTLSASPTTAVGQKALALASIVYTSPGQKALLHGKCKSKAKRKFQSELLSFYLIAKNTNKSPLL